VYAFAEAGEYLERALDLWARVPDAADAARRSRGDVLVGVALNLGGAGDFDRAVAYATAALAEPEIAEDPERGAELWQQIARYHLQDGNGPPGFEALQAAATLLDSAPQPRGRSRLAAEHALALAIWGGPAEATTQAERKCREMNVVSIGLTVFGPNKAAQNLYEDLGFEVTVLSDAQAPIDGLTGANTATSPESLSDESEQPGRLLLTTTNAVHGA
jgi:hypothetical protein